MRPSREPARNNQQTYFVSFATAQRTPLFRHERWLLLLLTIVERHQAEFDLHDYIVMEDHVHLLLTPHGPLERSLQLIKGGFSFQAKRQFDWNGEVWQRSFADHRIRDLEDYQTHVRYIQKNLESLREPMRIERGRHSGKSFLRMVPMPQRLKPLDAIEIDGAAEAAPFQNDDFDASCTASITPNDAMGDQRSL